MDFNSLKATLSLQNISILTSIRYVAVHIVIYVECSGYLHMKILAAEGN